MVFLRIGLSLGAALTGLLAGAGLGNRIAEFTGGG